MPGPLSTGAPGAGGGPGRPGDQPLGGDWGSGERVFGPPRGTVESDWFVPLVRERHPGVAHEVAREAVRSAAAAVREEAQRSGAALADVDVPAVRRALGLPGTAQAAGAGAAGAGDEPVLETALRVVLAAARAYGG